jgi:hypothetical protein
LASAASSGTIDDTHPGAEREALFHEFQSYKSELSSLFSAFPQSHILPKRDNISVSVSVDRPDVTIVPKGKTVSKEKRDASKRLDMAGWRATPLVAFSNKRFGVGFAGEAGEIQAHYLDKSGSDGSYLEEFGSARFSGLGIYGYFLPEVRLFPSFVTPLVLVGGKRLNVTHESTGTVTSKYVSKKTKEYSYSVNKYEVGLDFSILLAKRFTVLPWSSYSMVGIVDKGGASSTEPSTNGGTTTNGSGSEESTVNGALNADQSLFWKLDPTLNYGIDFVVELASLQIHLGGVMGLVSNIFKVNKQVYDGGLSVGIGYEFQSR